ncbi:MAG: hypothetical protein K2X82_18620 [Gemmataceae bacterium]|nr:hypothetical protein [Gemmataceae bacterium]
MRDPNRIIPVLDAIREVWEQSPDLRLGQLVVNAIRPRRPCPEVFAAEDDRVVAGLRGDGPAVPHDPTTVDVSLTPNEALIVLGFLMRLWVTKGPATPDVVERHVLANLQYDLLDRLARTVPPEPWDEAADRAKREWAADHAARRPEGASGNSPG